MTEQTMLLVFLALGLAVTLFLYLWKAKKQAEYRGDERWEAVQNRANRIANGANYILILSLVLVDLALMILEKDLTLSWGRISILGLLFISLRNAMELIALKVYDNRM